MNEHYIVYKNEAAANSGILFKLLTRLVQDKTMPRQFKEGLGKEFPQIENEILTYSINNSCECKDKINAYVTVYPQEFTNYIWNFCENNNLKDYLDSTYRAVVQDMSIPELSISGKVAKTTVKEWKPFVQTLEDKKLTYKGFSVCKEGEDVYVFFI